jgi:hypothetical protein
MRHPGIEPGSKAWEASMLTITPVALISYLYFTWILSSPMPLYKKQNQKIVLGTGIEPVTFCV